MKNRLLMMLPALVCFSGLAPAQEVRYNFDPGTDFSKYRTYKWVEIKGSAHPNQLVDSQIKSAIESQLGMKGLTPSEQNPDVDVGYQISIDKEKQLNSFGGWGGWGGGMQTMTTSTINNGTLVVDFYDPGRKMLVWRGQGTKTIDPSSNPEKNQERLQKAVAKIMKNYPPKQK
jgi:Domain of unknown function (DUF4136)